MIRFAGFLLAFNAFVVGVAIGRGADLLVLAVLLAPLLVTLTGFLVACWPRFTTAPREPGLTLIEHCNSPVRAGPAPFLAELNRVATGELNCVALEVDSLQPNGVAHVHVIITDPGVFERVVKPALREACCG